MCATPGACIKPGCLARRPLCHEVNLPGCEARRRHITCDIFDTGQANILALNIYSEKVMNQPTVAPLKSLKSTHSTKLLEKLLKLTLTHIPAEGFDDSLETCEIERCSLSVQTQFIVPRRSSQKLWSWVFNININTS